MVKYLKPGEDFGPQHFAEASFGFTQSASRTGGSMPDTNRAEAVRVRSGTNFEAQDPRSMDTNDRSYRRMENDEIAREPKRHGGPIRRADGGDVEDIKKPIQPIRGIPGIDESKYDPNRDRTPIPGRSIMDDRPFKPRESTVRLLKNGGPIRRAIGGVIPGNAPAPGMQPMTAPPSAAPMPGNPLAHVQVSMPASDLALMAKGAAKMGAGQAVSGLAQAARGRGGAQPVRMPGAPAMAPAAAPPPAAGALQGMAGMRPQGMKDGGKLTARARNALPASDFALPGGRYPIENKNHARAALSRASANASPAEQSRIRGAVHRKFPDIGKKG